MTHQERLEKLQSKLIIGTQYYRPPTPLPEDWEEDFARMRDIGITMIKFWVYWRWVEYRKGVLEFSDYDRLFELGAKYGIRMHPNLFVESAPQWVYDEFPGCLPMTMERVSVLPHDRISTQIGGYMPCFDHDPVRELAIRFIHQFVERYSHHPSLACWDTWNEIQLKAPGEVCACPASTAHYREWLERRYGNIEVLNQEWKLRYASFADVHPPLNRMNYASYMHWRLFCAERVAWHGQWRAQAIRDVDPDQAVMVHFGGSPVWSLIGNVPFMKAPEFGADFIGVSGHNFPGMRHEDSFKNNAALEANYSMLCSNESYPWASEVSSDVAVMGEFYPAPAMSREAMAYATLLPVSLGYKAVLYWEFKPEQCGQESPCLGLVQLNGEATERSHEVKRIAAFLETEVEFFAKAQPHSPTIGILHDQESSLLSSVIYDSPQHPGNRSAPLESLCGAYHAFRVLGEPACFVDSYQMAARNLDVIYLPMLSLARRAWLEPLQHFMENGGTLIAEGGLGQYREGDYFYEKTVPGSGLHELFGVAEASAAHEVYLRQDTGAATKAVTAVGSGTHGDVLGLSGNTGFADATDGFAIRWGEGGEFLGCFEKRPLRLLDAQPLAHFKDGSIAASVRQVGKGRAVYIGTSLSLAVWRGQSVCAEFLRSLLPNPSSWTDVCGAVLERVTVESLQYGNRTMLFVFNQSDGPVELKLAHQPMLRYVVNPDKDSLVGDLLRLSPQSSAVFEIHSIG